MFKAVVYVTLRESVLDPQGQAVKGALNTLGFDEVNNARIGKYMELELNSADRAQAEERVREMCEKLLANTVVEDYRFEIVEG
ncbi:phosphoribosylformylglycinamidine synthase subunit PurS [Brevibacillus gelatini]|uniref:Phosphoribosylformylglycinamidine synthase subunit PurS n=1 Tax=Brevibacillus gelatini TaxID=1655277 RepID=A0A3M8B369_9BACL|nr:phosphoribosylformylglycinamidine synthase subunit PurS [Brevibacillus gelatini]RNB57876.1 phosphoribosylformylglycinamidine synthase subunit PurS [Brevibacillus gelatini]